MAEKSQNPPAYNTVPGVSEAVAASSNDGFPSVPQISLHLLLLHSFWELREKISKIDTLFGIPSDGDVIEKVQEKRWAVYVARAVDRFTVWHQAHIDQCEARPLTMEAMSRDFASGSTGARHYTADDMPPLDILMVLHAYMLNPHDFYEDCLRKGIPGFWSTGMPWDTLAVCFDDKTSAYQPSGSAKKTFEHSTGLAWDNLDDPPHKTLTCPACPHRLNIPWTNWTSSTKRSVCYSDRDFAAVCSKCDAFINHDVLRAQKFRRDLQLLLTQDVPMPGTVLTLDGLADPIGASRGLTRGSSDERLFPSKLLKASGGAQILSALDLSRTPGMRLPDDGHVQGIRDGIQEYMRDRSLFQKVTNRSGSSLQRSERIAVRRMMANYWENASPWALDLVGAVIRQGVFVEKMVKIDWLHSPALAATAERLCIKYARFFEIMARHPNQVAVPTLDVDLAWHTHQLTPKEYITYSVQKTGKFIDHDDKIAETKLSNAFAETSKNYQKMFNEPYSLCTCWYCESIRASHTSSVTRLFKKSGESDPITARLHDAPSNPDASPHISAHNAIRPPRESKHMRLQRITYESRLRDDYNKAARRAQKDGRKVGAYPDGKKSSSSYAHGYAHGYAYAYPMYAPLYFPYYGAYCDPYAYANNPACGSFEPGAAGNCCSGTCGGGVAMGSCGGGAGAGSCAAGAAGGCGGGGGGGG